MAEYGGLEQILEISLPENPSIQESWNHIVSMKPRDHYSFTEIFDLYLKENDHDEDHSEYSSAASSSLFTLSPQSSISSDDDVDSAIKNVREEIHAYNSMMETTKRSWSRRMHGGFPPPISCIGKTGKPVWLQSIRQDGRFILAAVRIPSQDFLHASRENGRLTMHYVHSDEDEDDDDGDEGKKKEKEGSMGN